MNGEFLRGEVYWVSSGDSLGSELQSGRPGVIISTDYANREQETVVIAFLTQSEHPRGVPQFHAKVKVLDEERRVICQQVRTVDKSRLLRFVARISNADMERVSGALATSLSLKPPKSYVVERSAEPTEEIESLRLELEIAKRMYDKVLDQLVELRVAADISEREEEYEYEDEDIEEDVESGIEEEIVSEEVEDVEDIEEEDVAPLPRKSDKVNVNTATKEELMLVAGLAERSAREIVRYRKKNGPFKKKTDLLKVSRFGLGCYQKYDKKLVVGEPESETVLSIEELVNKRAVNINTANGPEIFAALGCPLTYASYIVAYRNKNGKYVDLEELLDVPRLPKVFLERYRDYLILEEPAPAESPAIVFDDVVEEPPIEEESRLNVNTVSTWELIAIGFDKQTAALITSHRKKYGKFKELDELLRIHGVTGKIMRKLADKLCV